MAAVALVRLGDEPPAPVASSWCSDPAIRQVAEEIHNLSAQMMHERQLALARAPLPATCPMEDEALFWTGDYPDAGGWECRVVDDVCAERQAALDGVRMR